MNTDKPLTAPDMPDYPDDPDERRVQIAYDARQAMLLVDDLQQEAAHVKRLRDALVADYKSTLDRIETEIRDARQQLRIMVEINGGKIQVPDVGTVWKSADSSVLSIEDPRLFAAWLDDGTREEAAEELLDRTPTVADKRAAAAWVEAELPGMGGELPPGCELKTRRGSLSVRLDDTASKRERS